MEKQQEQYMKGTPGGKGTPALRICEICEKEFYARPQARTCGPRCRKVLSRKNEIIGTGEMAIIYALKEATGNIYYVGSTLERAAPRGHVLPPGGEWVLVSRIPAENRYREEQNTIDKFRAEGHTLVNKYNPIKTGMWK